MSELEPCPFCGGEADYHIHERIGVECLACGAGFATVFGSREEAAEAWNRRAENDKLRREIALNEPLFETLNAANDALLAENAELRKMLDLVPNCDACEAMQDCWECLRADTSHHERKRLSVENAELRELVRIMHGELVSCEDNGYVCGGHKFDERVRELGVDA